MFFYQFYLKYKIILYLKIMDNFKSKNIINQKNIKKLDIKDFLIKEDIDDDELPTVIIKKKIKKIKEDFEYIDEK
jgi:hypothetical protein